MKKFYTLLAAATVVVGASASVPQAMPTMKQVPQRSLLKVQPSSEKADMAQRVDGKPAVVRNLNAGITVGTPIEKIPGYYAYDCFSNTTSNQGWNGEVQNLVQLGEAENTLDIHGFWLGPNNNNQFVNTVTGTYNQSAATLTIPGGTHVCSVQTQEGQADVYMYLAKFSGSNLMLSDEPVVMKYVGAQRGFTYEAPVSDNRYTEILVFTDKANAAGQAIERAYDFVVSMYDCKFNGMSGWTWTGTQSGDIEDYGYCYYEVFDNTLMLYNILGWGYDLYVEMAIDKTAKTATLDNQIINLVNSNNQEVPYIFCVEDGQNLNPVVPFNVTVEKEDGYTASVLERADMLVLNQEGSGYAPSNIKIYLDDIDLIGDAAINNVTADFDENAPVEYFNLQGVRVENPANGLFIKRQGNKVAKVVL